MITGDVNIRIRYNYNGVVGEWFNFRLSYGTDLPSSVNPDEGFKNDYFTKYGQYGDFGYLGGESEKYHLGDTLSVIYNKVPAGENYCMFEVEDTGMNIIISGNRMYFCNLETRTFFSTNDNFNVCYLWLNYIYLQNLNSFSFLSYLTEAEKYYKDSNYNLLKIGFSRGANCLLGFAKYGRVGYDYWYTIKNMNTIIYSSFMSVGMSFFSSWYKILTGNFYNQNSLLYYTYREGNEERKFYISKILDNTVLSNDPLSTNPSINLNPYTSAYNGILGNLQEEDPGFLIRDITLGTSPFYLLGNMFNSSASRSASFNSGLKLTYSREGTLSNWTVYLGLEKRRDDGLSLFMKSGTQNSSGTYEAMTCLDWVLGHERHYEPDNMVLQNTFLALSPRYNDKTISEIDALLEDVQGDYTKLLNKVFVFGSTTENIGEVSSTYANAIGVVESSRNFNPSLAWTSCLGFSNTYGYLSYVDTVYNKSDRYTIPTINKEKTINIDNSIKWAYILLDATIGGGGGNVPISGNGSIGGDGGATGGNGSFDDTNDKIGFSNDIGYSGGGFYLNKMNVEDIPLLTRWIGSFDIGLSKNEKIDAIIDMSYLSLPQNTTFGSSRILNILGNEVAVSTEELIVNKANQYYNYDLGSIVIKPYFGNFLDYESSYKLNLPFAGCLSLKPGDVINKTLNLQCSVDTMTGNVIYNVFINGTILYTLTGNCKTCTIPFKSENAVNTLARVMSTVTSVGASIAGIGAVAATGGALTPAVVGGIGASTAAVGGGIYSQLNKTDIGVNGTASSYAGAKMPLVPYLTIIRPVGNFTQEYLDDFGASYGFKTLASGRIGLFRGMSVIRELHLEGLGDATDGEISEIENIMKTGVIL